MMPKRAAGVGQSMTTEAQTQKAVRIVVPLIPPSVNHYKMRTRKGITFVSSEAMAFKSAVYTMAGGRSVPGTDYAVMIHLYLGKGQRGDIDNFAKLVLDGLVDAGVIYSDAWVTKLWMEKHRDRENPRTEIIVTGMDLATSTR